VPVIQEKLDWALRRERTFGTDSKKAILQEWHGKWYSGQRRSRWCSLASTEAPRASRLKLHKQLKRAESSVLVQARTSRTGRIGLAHFLNKARVPHCQAMRHQLVGVDLGTKQLSTYCYIAS
jgi:hypothetical protein